MGNTAAIAEAEAFRRKDRASKGGARAPEGGAEESKGGAEESKGGVEPSKGEARAPEVVSVPSGADAYKINLTSDNRIGGGTYADVYKIQKIDT
jgi:hypothetical protein